jgi:succinate dehydrogenase/fumarate reductase flavoprotein subunit
MGPIETPPFYAIRVYPGDIGASCGLETNEFAQVMHTDGKPIEGLYACGNDMDSLMAGIYPAPGITLGPAMTFGYLAARHAAQRTSTSSQKPSRPPTCAMDGRGES